MLFSSITFLYYFLPVVLFLYYLVPHSKKNGLLLLASLFFYGWGEPVFLLWMILAITMAYIAGLLIEKYKESRMGNLIFYSSVIGSVLYLGIFKYADFFIQTVNQLFQASFPLTGILLPIGISFYTFQLLSYLIDVKRGEVAARKDIISFALYISMFPQLIAGPIVRYSVIDKQLDHRDHRIENIGAGISRFAVGLSKKVLLANPLGELCEIIKATDDLSVCSLWLYAIAFSLHIYFDFSGYSDMAIGLGRMFGFHFWDNFRYPYGADSISDFWRRWHISLGTWFRDYVYIPLGGNRVGRFRFCMNLFLVWFLTGFWHGAGWNFIIWGLYYGILLAVEKFWLKEHLKRHKILSRIYVLFFVCIGFLIFDTGDMETFVFYLKGMFGFGSLPLISKEFLYYGRSFCLLLITAAAAAFPMGTYGWQQIAKQDRWKNIMPALEMILVIGSLLLCTAYLVDGSYNPFLYFRF